jgi:hypothetical protein
VVVNQIQIEPLSKHIVQHGDQKINDGRNINNISHHLFNTSLRGCLLFSRRDPPLTQLNKYLDFRGIFSLHIQHDVT